MAENTGPTFMDIDYVVAWTTTDLTTVAVDSKKEAGQFENAISNNPVWSQKSW